MTAGQWIAFKSRLCLLLAGLMLFAAVFSSSAFPLDSAEQIVGELDAHYYYPQQRGLNKLSVRIDWEQLDVITDSGLYLKNPPLAYFWEKGRGGSSSLPKGVFKLADKSFEVSDQRKKELLNMLENYKEVVIPQTLAEKLSNYKGRITVSKKKIRVIEFSALNPQAAIQKYELMVDLAQKNVKKFRIGRKEAPLQVQSDVRYSENEGQWQTAESRSKFRVGEMDYSEITEFVYRRVGDFWLMGKMTQTIKTEDRIIQSFIFRFRDYKIN